MSRTPDLSVKIGSMVAEDLVFFARNDMPVDVDGMVIAIGHECGVPKDRRDWLRMSIVEALDMLQSDDRVVERLAQLRERARSAERATKRTLQ
jgi:hypothetical protein